MKFVDSHIHLSDKGYLGSVEEVVREAENAGVVSLVSNSVDLQTCLRNLELAEQYSSMVHVALGVHPSMVSKLAQGEIQQVLELVQAQSKNKALVALGEIGLDSKYMEAWDKQTEVFDLMLRLAERVSLPVIVHSRGATLQVVEMLCSYRVKKVLLHWFSDPGEALSRAIGMGFYVSEGPSTYFSAGVRDVVRRVPLDSLLTETDGPVRFFRVPFEGRRTTPAFIPLIVEEMARIRGISPESMTEHVERSFEVFFGIRLN